MSEVKKCLIFGGNGFIGAEIVKCLVLASEHCDFVFDIAIANRGKSWDWDTRQTVAPYVKCLQCNRKNPLRTYDDLVTYVDSAGFLDIVVDLSAYTPFAIEETVDLLSSHDVTVGLYIFISSDSVYEVCQKEQSGRTKETDAVRPSDKIQRKRLKRSDSYGHKKLKCEEVLLRYKQLPSIILRLADVIGQRDSTERWWQYQLWVKTAAACNVPIFVPQHLKQQPMSFVYATDIARLVQRLAETGREKLRHLHGEAFNLGFADTVTTEQLLEDIRVNLKLPHPLGLRYLSEGAPQIFPSVDKGPIDVSKATDLLSWTPTPWPVVVEDIVKFYEDVAKSEQYRDKTGECFESLMQNLKGVTDVGLMRDKFREQRGLEVL